SAREQGRRDDSYHFPCVETFEEGNEPWEIADEVWVWRYKGEEHIRILPTGITDRECYPTAPRQEWLEAPLEEVTRLQATYPHATRFQPRLFEEVYDHIYELRMGLPTTNILADLEAQLQDEEENYGTQPPKWTPVPEADDDEEDQLPTDIVAASTIGKPKLVGQDLGTPPQTAMPQSILDFLDQDSQLRRNNFK